MERYQFYSDPKTQKVIFTTREYTSARGEECLRYICCHNYENPNEQYEIGARYFLLSDSFKISVTAENILRQFSDKFKQKYPRISREQFIKEITPIAEQLKDDMTSGNFVFCSGAQANPFFKIEFLKDWKHVTPDNATEYELRQVEYMINNSPQKGKHHALMEDSWNKLKTEAQQKKEQDRFSF